MLARVLKPTGPSRVISALVRHFSEGKRPLRVPLRSKSRTSALKRAPAPSAAPLAVEDAWSEVVDKSSGQIYYWNTVTNETTALGAPKPGSTELAQQQAPAGGGGGMMSGLGGVMAQGFAFGIGSSVAHSVVGSMFGGSSGGSDDAGGDSGDSGFDV